MTTRAIALWALLPAALLAQPAIPQDASQDKIHTPGFFENGETTLMGRIGFDGKTAYRYFEGIYRKRRWIVPDVGYIDFGQATAYREVWLGGGFVPYDGQHLLVVAEGYLDQATGPQAGSALYAQPYFFVKLKPVHRVTGDAVYFIYVPISGQATVQHVLEHAKLEYMFGRFKVGAGYGAYGRTGQTWQNRPFLTTTFQTRKWGAIELWLQHLAGSSLGSWELQLRYAITIASRN